MQTTIKNRSSKRNADAMAFHGVGVRLLVASMLLALVLFLGGCRTADAGLSGLLHQPPGGSPAPVEPAANAAKGIPASVDREIEAAWSAYQAAVSKEEMRDSVLEKAEAFQRLADQVLQTFAGMPDETRFRLTTRRTEARKTFLELHAASLLEVSESQYGDASRFSEAIAACRRAVAVLQGILNEPVWGDTERARLEEIGLDWGAREKRECEALNSAIVALRAALVSAQRAFITRQAIGDVRAAEGYLELEKRKRINWDWLGNPRDNVSVLYAAVQRANRAVSYPQVDSPVRCRAAAVRESIMDRFNKKETAVYGRLPDLAQYNSFAAYPALTETEIQDQADQSRKPMQAPLIDPEISSGQGISQTGGLNTNHASVN